MMTTNKKNLGIYIHIPFCKSKCIYCGFYSKGGELSEEKEEKYVNDIIEDIECYSREYGKYYIVDTVFIGGGTPSILHPENIDRILQKLRECFNISDDSEITIETNPGTLDFEKLCLYRTYGINRLSMGVQSLDDNILKRLGRIHDAETFRKNFSDARRAGFDNINLDFMFSVPGHSIDIWLETLKEAVRLNPEHLSLYSLQIEEGTPLFDMFVSGEIEQIPDEIDREMYHTAITLLKQAGYEHYEISNFAKPGYECRHNLKYWSMDEYLGIGDSASSYIEGMRFTEAPYPEFHINTFEDDVSEFVFTGLRKIKGICLTEFEKKFGKKFFDVFSDRIEELRPFIENKYITEENGFLRLTESGIDISNKIMSIFV